MASILTEEWLWIIIIALILILVFPFVVIMLIQTLPSPYNGLVTICIIIGWGVAAGYKDWIISKEREEKQDYK